MKYRKLFIFILIYFLFLHENHIYSSSSTKIFLEDPNNYGQIQKNHLNEIPRELKSLICHYLSDPLDLYSVSLLNKEHAKLIREKNEKERINTFNHLPKERMNNYLRTLCEAPLHDLWLLRLEMRLAHESLSKIRNSETAFKYIKDAKRYFKHSQRESVGQPLENLHLYKCIYSKSLLLFKKFASQFPEEHKFLYSRLLLHASKLQSLSEKNKAIRNIQNFCTSKNLGIYADYYLLFQARKAETEEFEKLDARIPRYIYKDYKLLKLQFDLANHCFNSVDISAEYKSSFNQIFIKFQECKRDALIKLEHLLKINLGIREGISEVREDLFFENLPHYLMNLKTYGGTQAIQYEIGKSLKILIKSLYNISISHYVGLGTESNKEFGISLLKILASYGDTKSQSKLGTIFYIKEKQYTEAFKFIKMAAIQGSYLDMWRIAEMYLIGRGVKKNYQEAFDWNVRAARYNSVIAQYYIGVMYEKGLNVEVNYQQAFKWYYKALGNGEEIANFHLGWLYDKGLGVNRNAQKATSYYSKFMTIIAAYSLTQPSFSRAQHLAADIHRYGLRKEKYIPDVMNIYKKLAVDENYGPSQASLGRLYKEGWPIFSDRNCNSIIEYPNLEFAKIYLNQACEQDEAAGHYNLALMYRDGEGVERDDREACGLLSLAAVQMHGDALYTLGWMYEQGRGVDKDLEKADYLYHEGEKRYPADALYSLGRMYELGLNVDINLPEAIKWYRKAADLYCNDAEERLASLENTNFNNLKEY